LRALGFRHTVPAANFDYEFSGIETQVRLRVLIAHNTSDDGRRVSARVFPKVEGALAIKRKLDGFLLDVERTGDIGRAEALLREGFDLEVEAVGCHI
jgi:hypothetical protein